MSAFRTVVLDANPAETESRAPALALVPALGAVNAAGIGEPAEVSPIDEVHIRDATYRRLLMFADALSAMIATTLAAFITGVAPSWLFFLPALAAVFVAKVQGLYDRDDVVIHKSSLAEWRIVLQAASITSVLLYLAWRLMTTAPRGGGVRLLIFLAAIIFGVDLIARYLARRAARALTPAERIVIIGNPRRCAQLAHNLFDLPGVDLIGTIPDGQLEGSIEELHAVVTQLHSHRLVIAPDSDQSEATTLEVIRSAKALGVRVSLMPTIMTVVGGRAAFDDVHGLTLLGVPRFGLSRSSSLLKRSFDVIGASVGIILTAPLFLLLAIAVKLDSHGPVIFHQTRVGRDGRRFQILKFRTMVEGADQMKAELSKHNEASDGLFKISADPRITRVGRRLRAMHADELPQLWNVLAGDMSLVGPRPLVVEEDAQLSATTSQRLRLTPGITGPWQIRGPMNASLSEMARLDYQYISSWSIWRDVDILIRTGQRVLERGGH